MKLPIFSILSLSVGATLAVGADAPRAPSIPAPDVAIQPEAQRETAATVYASASKPAPKPTPLVMLDIEAPMYRPTLPNGIEFASGWPLVIHAAASPDALGIATDAAPVQFPGIDQNGYLILRDPDGCLELPPPFFRGSPPCSEAPSDETYVGFTPGVDQAGIADTGGNPGLMAQLADPAASGNPLYDAVGEDADHDGALDPVEAAVGPDTGGIVSDGIGYGADDDLPGLVLLSPHGPGLVLNPDFSRPAVLVERNLAGFINSVAYELRDAAGSTSFDATMVVPTGLIAPVMKIDACVGTETDGRCDGDSRYQIDGGSILTTTGPTGPQALYPQVLGAMTYEVRAFLVSGVAPSVLSDLNHDGQVTAADARLAGYTVISNEESVRVRQYSTDICTGVPLVDVIYADFDHNGHATAGFTCPAGPGQITPIPR